MRETEEQQQTSSRVGLLPGKIDHLELGLVRSNSDDNHDSVKNRQCLHS